MSLAIVRLLFMKVIQFKDISDAVSEVVKSTLITLTPSAERALNRAAEKESGDLARFALETLIENCAYAKEYKKPLCQDTGMAVFFVELGQEVKIEGGLLTDAINLGVAKGYAEGGFRASVLDPITRENTLANTPAVIHIDLVAGDNLKLIFLPKGFGSENMSKLFMLTPSDGIKAAEDKIVEAVMSAGSNPCPPIVVGVGIGGTAELAMQIAKRQLTREIDDTNSDAVLSDMENRLLERINGLKIGAQGFHGDTTAFAVKIGKYPTHISALPVAVNIQCNAVRLGRVTL